MDTMASDIDEEWNRDRHVRQEKCRGPIRRTDANLTAGSVSPDPLFWNPPEQVLRTNVGGRARQA